MSNKTGKISTIKKEYNSSTLQTMQGELSKRGMSRIPGTGVFKYPYKELDGQYRTGLDENASYIRRIANDQERELEKERVKKLRDELEKLLNLDLGPRSNFWDASKSKSATDTTHIQPVKLMDGDNYFDFSIPIKKLEFAWLRVHPTIASSYEAWQRGEFPADTQFYVADDEIESKLTYNKKQAANKALVKFQDMSPEKRRKVARALGLPVTEDTKEDVVYNMIDDVLKQNELKNGKHLGLDPVKVFLQYADMKENLLHVKDLVKQAISHSIYRLKSGGKIYEGEHEISKDEDDLVKYLIDDDHQDDLLMLEQKLKTKKLSAV